MISIYCWNKAQEAGFWLNPEMFQNRLDELRATTNLLWIDLDHPTPDEERLVFEEFFHIHPLSLEDITKLRREPDGLPHFPKAEEFPDYLFVIANPLAPAFLAAIEGKSSALVHAEERPATQLSAIIRSNVLITHHYETLPSIEALRLYLTKHEAQADRGPDYLFHLILDAMVDQFVPALDHFDDALDEIESRVFEKPTRELLQTLLQLKREIIQLRKTLIYQREVLARLARGEFSLIDEREMVYYRNVYDHLVRFTELIESSREMVTDLMQTQLAAASNKLNEIMKVLTMISTIILPLSLISGIYGMNFKHMPELEWFWGYPFALALMGCVGLGSFIFFKWKKWF